MIFLKKKLLVVLLILCGLGFTAYTYKYQQIVNESSMLADERCLVIDPLIDQNREFRCFQFFPAIPWDKKGMPRGVMFSQTSGLKLRTSKKLYWTGVGVT